MGQETENIEAKLAAYIDGQLGSVERLEIEKYLAGNPEHKALIAELMRTRDVVTSLPKESAPPEIVEMLHGQLERSALLDGPAVAQPILRISRWPQMAALAAILFLTVGLAVVLYVVLFPPHPIAFSVAPTRPPATMDAVADGEQIAPSGMAPAKSAAAPTTLETKTALADAATGVDKKEDQKSQSTTLPANNGDALVMVVATDNPQLTQTQVADYFKNNGIAWQPVAEPMPAPLKFAQSQVVEGSRFNMVQKQLAEKAPSGASVNGVGGEVSALGQQTANQNQLAAATQSSSTDNAYVARGVTRRQASDLAYSLSNSRKGQQAYFSPDDASAARDLVDTQLNSSRSAAVTLESTQSKTPALTEKDLSLKDASKKDTSPEATKETVAATPANPSVAANAPPSTAPALLPAPSVPADEARTRAEVAATTAPTSQPSQLIAKNDTLMISVSDLAGPGLDSVLRATVADDGSISLPAIGKVNAAGLTPTQCQQAIADQVRLANLVQNATVSVRKLDDLAIARQRPILKASAIPRDDKVDVLILLRNQQQTPAASTLPPTSEPSPAPAQKP